MQRLKNWARRIRNPTGDWKRWCRSATTMYLTISPTPPSHPLAAPCHWKVTWSTYLHDPAQAEGMLREHLTHYAASDQTSPALYYLGRIAESKSDWPTARAYYDAVNNAYPNYYYAILARERLETHSLLSAVRAPATAQFLSAIQI